MAVELTIIIKDAEKKKLSLPFIIYEKFSLSDDDPLLKKHIEEALKEFKGEPEDIIVKAQKIFK